MAVRLQKLFLLPKYGRCPRASTRCRLSIPCHQHRGTHNTSLKKFTSSSDPLFRLRKHRLHFNNLCCPTRRAQNIFRSLAEVQPAAHPLSMALRAICPIAYATQQKNLEGAEELANNKDRAAAVQVANTLWIYRMSNKLNCIN